MNQRQPAQSRRLPAAPPPASPGRYRRLFEAAQDGLLLLDPTTQRVLDANPFLTELLGRSREELLGQTPCELGLFPTREACQAFFAAVRQQGYLRQEDLPLVTKAGQCRQVEFISTLYEEAEGPVIQCAVRDIAERKRVEEALQESETRFRAAFESGAIAMALTSMDCKLLQVNAAFCRLLGYTQAELVGRPFTDITHPEDLPANLRGTEQLFRGQVPSLRLEKRYVRKDGTVIWGDMSTAVVSDAQGRPLYCVTHVQDITKRRRLEQEVRESERKFRALFDHAKDAMFIHDLQGRFLDVNPEACARLGYSREELLRMGPRDVDTPEYAALVPVRMQELLQQGQVLFESAHQRRDGTTVQVEISSTRLTLGGTPLVFSTCRDITARKQAEETLRRAEARLAQAVRVAGLGTFEHDHRTDVIEHSPVMRELMGFNETETITLPRVLARVLPEDRERLAAAIRRAHDPAGDGNFEVEYRARGRDGKIRWLNARSQTYFEGAGPARHAVRTIGAVLDVTERKDVQAGLERLVAERTAKLQELVGELEHFSYTITHDMRAPLRAMQGYAELMSGGCAARLEERTVEFLRRIKIAAQRMDALITDALNYNRAVREQLTLAPVDPGALLRGMLDSYPELQPARAHIELQGELPRVLANAAGLTQCFSNLLDNAVKFVQPGQKPQIRIWAEPVSSSANPTVAAKVRLWVEDRGIGIPPSMLPRVFEMFSRGQDTYAGTGIGLALVRKVAERMGGKVGVESEEGKGSRFWLELQSAEPLGQSQSPGAAPPG